MRVVALALASAIAASSLAGRADAAAVQVQVRGADGQPLAGAVVMLSPAQRPATPIRLPWPYVVAQKDISFQPHVLIVPVGAAVTFPNMDRVRHHVYSFSKPKKFELKLYGREDARTVTFDKPGVVAIGCNIHDRMSGYVIVVETPFAAQTDAQGRVGFTGVPVGGASLAVWHPSITARENRVAEDVSVPAAGLAETMTTGR